MPILYFFFILLFAQLGYSEENDYPLSSEAEPLATVGGCVNAISGEFFQINPDVSVNCADPLNFILCYDSGVKEITPYGKGFGSQFPFFIRGFENIDNSSLSAHLSTREGSYLSVGCNKSKKEKHAYLRIDKETLEKGVTNYSETGIGAKSNPLHTLAEYDGGGRICVTEADGTKRHYENRKYGFQLVLEEKPNTHKITYEYHQGQGNEQLIKRIAVQNQNQDVTFGWLEFDYGINWVDVHGSNSRWTRYTTEMNKYYFNGVAQKIEMMRSARPQNGPLRQYRACEKLRQGGRMKFDRIDSPEGRYLGIHYLPNGKVGALYSPVGTDDSGITTHVFKYHKYYTEVFDAEGNLKTYHFKNNRLTKIESPEFNENFYWSDSQKHKDRDRESNGKYVHFKGFLFGKATLDKNEKAHCLVSYDYDRDNNGSIRWGNITSETIHGNLTGNAPKTFSIDKEGNPTSNTESFTKNYTYSTDGLNLCLSERDSLGQEVIYSYLPGSNLKTSKIIRENDRSLIRTFYDYDCNALLTHVTEDDGVGVDKDDFTGITERTVTYFCPIADPNNKNFGKTACKQEYYIDPKTRESRNLKRTDYTYNDYGQVTSERIHDKEGAFCYELYTKYSDYGRHVLEQNDPTGNIIRFEYDANYNKTKDYYPYENREIKYDYDYSNRLIKTTESYSDLPQAITSYKYNTLNQLVAKTDRFGNTTTYKYDAVGREIECALPEIELSDGTWRTSVSKKSYDAAGNIIRLEGPTGVTEYEYNAYGKPTAIIHPDGSKECFEYYLNGWLAKETDENGNFTRYQYDALGQKISQKEFDSSDNPLREQQWQYKGKKLVSQIDPMGHLTEYKYDGAGRKVEQIAHGEGVTISTYFDYDNFGRFNKTIHPYENGEQRIDINVYDNAGRLNEERTENEHHEIRRKVSYEYDYQGNCTKSFTHSDENTFSTLTRTYFGNKELSSETDEGGYTTYFTYDYNYVNAAGKTILLKTTTDPRGVKTIEEFDNQDRVICTKKIDPLGLILTENKVYYSLAGQKTEHLEKRFYNNISELNYSIKWTYDKRGRQLTQQEQGKKTTYFSYDKCGQLLTCTKPNGKKLLYSYDALGRLTQLESSDNTVNYENFYNLNDQILCSKDLVNNQETYRSYDEFNRMVQETLGNGLTVNYNYHPLGNLKLITLPDSTSMEYEYNATDLLAVHRNTHKGRYTHSYLQTDWRGFSHSVQNIHGSAASYEYDVFGRNTAIRTLNWHQTLNKFDPNGNLLSETLKDPSGLVTINYTYDYLDQVIQENSTQYGYDSLGNRRKVNDRAYDVNELNQLTCAVYDYNGNMVDVDYTIYTYDALDRIIKATRDGQEVVYTYDSFGRRLTRSQNGETVKYLYQGTHEIGAYKNDRCTELRVLGKSRNADVGATIAVELEDQIYSVQCNQRGNIVHLTDENNDPVLLNRFNAFGEQVDSPSNLACPWGYACKRMDPFTKLIHFAFRDYSPKHGRWMTTDPAHFADGINLYHFVHNNPLSLCDPYGLAAENDSRPAQENRPWYQRTWESTKKISEYTCNFGKRVVVATTRGASDAITDPYLTDGIMGSREQYPDWGSMNFDQKTSYCSEKAGNFGGVGLTYLPQIRIIKVSAICTAIAWAGLRQCAKDAVKNYIRSPNPSAGSKKPDTEVLTMDPQLIRFSQDSIKSSFKDGRNVNALRDGLINGTINPLDVNPIRLVYKDGIYHSLDNRRLSAFKEAGVKIPYRMATQKEIRTNDFKFRSGSDGTNIKVRGKND